MHGDRERDKVLVNNGQLCLQTPRHKVHANRLDQCVLKCSTKYGRDLVRISKLMYCICVPDRDGCKRKLLFKYFLVMNNYNIFQNMNIRLDKSMQSFKVLKLCKIKWRIIIRKQCFRQRWDKNVRCLPSATGKAFPQTDGRHTILFEVRWT